MSCTTWTSAQLTNGQVYNFEVGDVHQMKGIYISSGSGSSLIQTDTVIYKSYSTGLDSITYHIQRQNYNSPGPGTPSTITESIDTLIITNLNLPAIHFTPNSCLTPTDTSYTDSCGLYYERLSSNFDSTCFEPNFWNSDLYAGIGGPYHYENNTVGNYTASWNLIYHNTVQQGECGTPATFVSIGEKTLPKIMLYPNPSSGLLTIDITNAVGDNSHISLSNLSGVQLNSFEIDSNTQSLNLSDLPSGTYIIQLIFNDIIVSNQRIVLH
jgi:hypothetical protein